MRLQPAEGYSEDEDCDDIDRPDGADGDHRATKKIAGACRGNTRPVKMVLTSNDKRGHNEQRKTGNRIHGVD